MTSYGGVGSPLHHIATIGGLEKHLPNVAAVITKYNLDLSNNTVSRIRTDSRTAQHGQSKMGLADPGLRARGHKHRFFSARTIFTTRSRNVRLWKNSTLSLLYHGLDPRK